MAPLSTFHYGVLLWMAILLDCVLVKNKTPVVQSSSDYGPLIARFDRTQYVPSVYAYYMLCYSDWR